MAKSQKPKKAAPQIQFKFMFPEDYKPCYANGVWGGITPKGELEMHFIYDRRPLPLKTSHAIRDGELLGEPISIEGGQSLLRFIQTGVVMSPQAAESFYDWLGEKIEKLKTLKGNADENGNADLPE
jgi:hypothetical protein